MKKIIASFSMVLICLILVACNGSKDNVSTVRYESMDNGVKSEVKFEVKDEKVLKEALSVQTPFSAMGATDKKSAKEVVKQLKKSSKDKTTDAVIKYQVTDNYIEVTTITEYQSDNKVKEKKYPILKSRVEAYKVIGYKIVK